MKTTITTLLLLVHVAFCTHWQSLDAYTFEMYLNEYGLNYSTQEIDMRRNSFLNELSRVRTHNQKNLSWKESINKFSAMTAQEKKAFHGRSKSHAQKQKLQHAQKLPENFSLKPVSSLPSSIDWRTISSHSSVKDQGSCGSCWAFASTAVIESHVFLNTGKLFDLSVQQMAMCAPNPDSCGGTGGCAGSTAELAFDYVTKSSGLYEEYQYGYSSYYGQNLACSIPSGKPVASINGFVQLPENNYTALMNAVATVGPVAISVDASNWGAYHSGIFNGCGVTYSDIDHAVVLMGYGEESGQKYWLIRNSWSPNWGEFGYIRITRSNDDETNCVMDTTPQDGTACAGETDPVKVCGSCGVLYDSSYPLQAGTV